MINFDVLLRTCVCKKLWFNARLEKRLLTHHKLIPVCIWVWGGTPENLHMGSPCLHNKFVLIRGVTYMLLPIRAQICYVNRDSRIKYISDPCSYAYRDPHMHTTIPMHYFAYGDTRLDFQYGNVSCMHTVSD